MPLFLFTVPFHLLEEHKRPLFFLLSAFLLTFIFARIITRVMRFISKNLPKSRGSLVTRSGLHIHHAVFGVIAIIVAGILEFALRPPSPWVELLGALFGAGAALTLDEFALILHLEDVYWTGEGRKSIDAVILAATFMVLLLTGLLPSTTLELGDHITLSRWLGFTLILVNSVFVVVAYLKGKLFTGTLGIFLTPFAVIGAVRLAKPNSPWMHSRYAADRVKFQRAQRRAEVHDRRWGRAKYKLWDIIGGRPHLHAPVGERRDPMWSTRVVVSVPEPVASESVATDYRLPDRRPPAGR